MTSQDEFLKPVQLAQKHHKIIPGLIVGEKTWTPDISSPGVTGFVRVKFTTSGKLPVGSRILLELPHSKWKLTKHPNTSVKVASGIPAFTLKSTWSELQSHLDNTIETHDIDAGTSIELSIPGVTTPDCALHSEEITITTFQKKIYRNTVPPSVCGGQIIDGPSIITTSKILPGEIKGHSKWNPMNIYPGRIGDVNLFFEITGAIPSKGKILVELPPSDQWKMNQTPTIRLVCNSLEYNVSAFWEESQGVLELVIQHPTGVPMHSKLALTVQDVTNPPYELPPSFARLTTLVANGGVIDGPTKISTSRISKLSKQDMDKALSMFDHFDEEKLGKIPVEKLRPLLESLDVKLNDPRYDQYVTDTRVVIPNDKAGTVSKGNFENLFVQVYAPTLKYGATLRAAASRGEVSEAQELISRGCDPNGRDGNGWTSLHHAAASGHVKIIQLLFDLRQKNLEIDPKDTAGWTPLMCAASYGELECVQILMEHGANVNAFNIVKRTALHWAAMKGFESIVHLLIQNGAQTNCIDCVGWTPLHCAALNGNLSIAKVLLEKGGNHHNGDICGYTMQRYCDQTMTSALLDYLKVVSSRQNNAI